MSQIRGGIGQSLSRILDFLGGRVALDTFNDVDGITPVYDVGRLAESELYVQDTRGFDTGAFAQSTTSTQLISDLPPIFSLLGIFVSADDATRINAVRIGMEDVGAAGSTRDWPLWSWFAGEATQPNTWDIGDAALAALLVPATVSRQFWVPGIPMTNKATLSQRQGGLRIRARVTSTAFGAGTVRCTGHIVIGFFRRNRDLPAIRPF